MDQLLIDDMIRTLKGIADVNMQTRNDAERLRELAEWRLEAKRVLAAIPRKCGGNGP